MNINSMIEQLTETTSIHELHYLEDSIKAEIDVQAEGNTYPHYGYTTAQVFETAEEWANWKYNELKVAVEEAQTHLNKPLTTAQVKSQIENIIRNESDYAETHVGYHAEYRQFNGIWVRGAYAQIARPHGGTYRIYAQSYSELLSDVQAAFIAQ